MVIAFMSLVDQAIVFFEVNPIGQDYRGREGN